MALPLAGNLYGDLGLALASVAMVAMTPVLNVLCVSVLVRYASTDTTDWRSVLLAIVRNPLIWACVVGAALNPVNACDPAAHPHRSSMRSAARRSRSAC